MKNKTISRISTLILMIVFCCSIFAVFNFSTNKNINIETYAATNVEQTNQSPNYDDLIEFSCSADEFKTPNQLQQFASENEYFYYYNGNTICFYNQFALKTLSVLGEFDHSQYKNVTVSGMTTVLKFDTIEETKQAYLRLTSNLELIVVADRIATANASTDSSVSAQAYGWGYSAINVEPYQNYLTEMSATQEVVVAVIDTGINTTHEMFENRILTDSSGKLVGIAETATTYTYSSYAFEDDNGHGTHVSGIICDTTPENVKILPIKLLDSEGSFGYSSLSLYEELFNKIVALKSTYNIVCVNMSFGADGATATEVSIVDAYLKNVLIKNNILPILAAGNKIAISSGGDGTCHDISSSFALPASCPNGVTVSALKRSGANYVYDSSYSYYGSLVDISAPGTAIKSAYIGGSTRYATLSGTSMATPYVSAVVALLCLDPIYGEDADVLTVEQRMYDLSIDLGTSGKDIYYGNGMVCLTDFKGSIEYVAVDTTVDYDAEYHNIKLTVNNVASYTVKYGLTSSAINLTTIEGNVNFKNYTNGKITVYFIISATDMIDTFGFAYLQINQADVYIDIENQYGTYGDTPSISQTKYSITSGQLYGTDSLRLKLSTSATRLSTPGDYNINFSHTNTNYNVICSSAGSYIINKCSVNIKLNNQSITYGDDVVLDNTSYTVVSGSVVNNDLNLTLSTTASKGSVVGSYVIDIVSYNHDCYILNSYTSGSLSITTRPISISIAQTVVYGEQITLDVSNYTIKTGSIYNNDTLIEQISTTAQVGSNVGEYGITVDKHNQNYNLNLSSGVLTITKRSATIAVGNQSKVYGDDVLLNQQEYTISNLVAGDSVDVTLTTSATKTSPVNTTGYSISATASNPNYFLSIIAGKLYVEPRTIEIYYYESFVYGDKININADSFIDVNNKLIDDDDLDLSLTCSAVQYNPVGDYLVEINGYNTNYLPSLTNESKLNIAPRAATVKVGDLSVRYGDAIDASKASVDLTEILYQDKSKLNYNLTVSELAKDVGDYDINFEYSNDNYTITVEKGVLSITQRAITILVQKSFCYGDEIDLTNVDYTVISSVKPVDGDDLAIELSTTVTQYSSVDKYTNLSLVAANSNYNITISTSSYIEITPRQISIKIGDTSSKFGEEIDLSSVTVDLSEVLNNDQLNIVLSTTATKTSEAGQYPITLTYNNSNYLVDVVEGKYHIYYRIINITIDNQNSIYGDTISLNNLAYSIAETDVQKSDLAIEFGTNATTKSGVGDYQIFVKSNATNYEIACENGTLTILARPIEINIEQTVCYGSQFVFDGNYTVVSGSVVNNDDLNLSLSSERTLYSPVGEYDLALISSNANYDVNLISGVLSVTPKQISVTIGNETKTYGDAVDLSAVMIDLSQVENDDQLNPQLITSATQTSAVGSYDINLTYSNANYTVVVVKGKLIVVPKSVEIIIQNTTSEYGQTINLPISLVSLTDYSVDVSVLDISLFCSANSKSSVGDYSITATCQNQNYTLIDNSNATLTIKAKSAKLIIGNKKSTYGSTIDLSNVQYTTQNVIENDDLGVALKTTATSKSTVGEYEINAQTTNTNYSVEIITGKLEIEAKSIILQVQQYGVYGDEHSLNNQDFVDVENAVLDGDDLLLELACDVQKYSPAQNYSISVSCGNNNYIVNLQNSFYQIKPKEIEITIGSSSVIYGNNVDESVIFVDQSARLNNDDLNLTFIYNVNDTTAVGEYEISATSANTNYIVEVVDGTINVTKRDVTVCVTDEMEYGENNKITSKYTLVSGSVVNNDDLNLKLTSTHYQNSPVGEYPLSLLSNNENYNVTLTSNSVLTIVPKTIVVAVGAKQATYLDEIDLSNVEVDLSNVLFNDDLNYSLTTTAQQTSDVGVYVINLTSSNANYTIIVSQGSYIITSKEVKIQISDVQLTYGDQIDEDMFEFVCLDDEVDKDDLQIKLSSTAEQFADVGSYSINVEESSANYQVNSNAGELKIVPKKLKIKLNSQTRKHFTTLQPNQNDYTIIEGEIYNNDDLNLKISTDFKLLLWGEFYLTGKVNNDNYQVEIINGTIKVEYSYIDTIILVAVALISVVLIAKHIHTKKRRTMIRPIKL